LATREGIHWQPEGEHKASQLISYLKMRHGTDDLFMAFFKRLWQMLTATIARILLNSV